MTPKKFSALHKHVLKVFLLTRMVRNWSRDSPIGGQTKEKPDHSHFSVSFIWDQFRVVLENYPMSKLGEIVVFTVSKAEKTTPSDPHISHRHSILTGQTKFSMENIFLSLFPNIPKGPKFFFGQKISPSPYILLEGHAHIPHCSDFCSSLYNFSWLTEIDAEHTLDTINLSLSEEYTNKMFITISLPS